MVLSTNFKRLFKLKTLQKLFMKNQFYSLSVLLAFLFISVTSVAQSGNALSLDGINSYMSVADHSDLDIAPGQTKTITCWIKTTSPSTATSRIIAKRGGSNTLNPSTTGTTGTGYEMWMGSGANAGKMAGNAAAWNTVASSSQSFSTAGYNPVASNDGVWHHIAAVFDNSSTNKTVTFYVDGINPNFKVGTFSATYDFSTAVSFIVGAATNATNFFNGLIDDVRIWNVAMSQAQVQTDMTTAIHGPATNLLAAWDFENVTAPSIPDVSGNSHTGTLNGNATIAAISGNMTYSSTSLTQTELPAGRGNADQRIIAINVQTNGTTSPLSLTALGLTMTGTTNIADVSNIKIYYTGSSSRFATTTSLGSVSPATGTLTATGSQTLLSGSNYFWIAYDVSTSATEGDLLDATCESVTVGGTAYTITSPNNTVAGSRTVLLANTLLYAPGDAGSVSYRIPAIITAADGSLVTVTDKRWNNTADLKNKIDLVVRRSTDNGQSWSAPLTISNFGSPNGTGDAALVLDKVVNPGTLLCLFAANVGFGASTPTVPINIQYCKSTDNGQTWSLPSDITNQVYGAGCSNPISKTWYGAFVASGRMHQLRSGRIIAVLDVRQTSGGTQDNFTMHSDDGGSTWVAETSDATTNGIAAAGQANEAKLVQLDNGNLMMSTRHAPNQLMSISTNAGVKWGTATSNAQLVEPSCNGDFIRYTSTVDGYNKSRLLQSIPNNSGTRKDVSVFISYDEGATWNTSRSIYPQASAYSSLTILPDGTIGIYYENGEYGDVYDMYFARFSLNWLTNGADTYLTPAPLISLHSSPSSLNLINFEGKLSANKQQTLLHWRTGNEINSSPFEVEYSIDGNTFNKVGEVAALNGSSRNDYKFTHNIPSQNSIIYYRLKIVDKNGEFTYSNTLPFDKTGTSFLTASPNPVTNMASVSASFTGEASVSIISAASGQTVKKFNTNQNAFTIDMSALPNQLYLLKLQTATSEDIIKIVKQ
jgi:hypothetical protein